MSTPEHPPESAEPAADPAAGHAPVGAAEGMIQADGPAAPSSEPAAPIAPELLGVLVQAWHNRHPLARRIQAAEVNGAGLVCLPFQATPAARGSLGARVSSWLAPLALRVRPLWSALVKRLGGRSDVAAPAGPPMFREDQLIPGLSHRQIVGLARRAGFVEPPGEADWPVRMLMAPGQVVPAPAAPEGADLRYLISVAIQAPGGGPVRILIGRSSSGWWRRSRTPVLGRRQWSRKRLGVALVVLGTLLALAAWGLPRLWQARQQQAAHAAQVAEAAAAASAAQAASAAAQAAAASAALAAAEAASAASAAAAASEAASAAEAAASAADVEAAASEPAAPMGPVWALVSSHYLRAVILEADRKTLMAWAQTEDPNLKVEVMQTPSGPVLAVWPVQDEATAARWVERLQRRGLRLQVVEF